MEGMKKIDIYIAMFSVLFFFSACNDEWKDELYTHMVSLKAPLNGEGVSNVYLRYHPNGEAIFNLPVLRSGSTLSDEVTDVVIRVDNDTLGILNNEKFMDREDLYYKQLPEQYYELLSPSCHIPGGSNKELFQVKFKFAGLDLSNEWILPLMIEDNPAYVINRRKGWGKALLHVLPFNDYSGTYSGTAMNIYFDDSGNDPLIVSERKAHVVDEKTVFFYAGAKMDDAIDRGTYKIFVRFEQGTTDADGTIRGNLTVSAEFPEKIGFENIGQATYEIRSRKDDKEPYLVRRAYVLYMKYRYTDVTSVENSPVTYRAEGSMAMERKINTLIPDQDQGIMWDE